MGQVSLSSLPLRLASIRNREHAQAGDECTYLKVLNDRRTLDLMFTRAWRALPLSVKTGGKFVRQSVPLLEIDRLAVLTRLACISYLQR